MYAFVEKDFHRALQPLLHDVLCLSVTPQTPVGQKLLEVEKQKIIVRCQVEITHRMLAIFQPELFEQRACAGNGVRA
jgi:hypothetical protein